MSYVWGATELGFEHPTCYRTENRFLMLRGALLLLGALVVMWVALSDPEAAGPTVDLLVKSERGSPTPHVVAALVLLVLGVVDLIKAARQRRVMLSPGQPASLGQELSRQASGTSVHAAGLQALLERGTWARPQLQGPLSGLLGRLSGRVALAPVVAQHYLRQRLVHLLFALAMLVVLLPLWGMGAARPALPLALLLLGGLAGVLVARAIWFSHAAPGLWMLASTTGLVVLAAAGLTLLGDGLPYVAKMRQLSLPGATVLAFGLMIAIESLALLAARAQLAGPPRANLAKADAEAEVTADPARLMQELEREMHRYWADGVPNRRYMWELPSPEGRAAVLEESQPQPLPERADREGFDQRARPWLVALCVLGLLMTLAGVVLWVLLAYHLIQNAKAPWATAALSVVLVAGGGYALRIGHLLWSLTEVESLLISVSFAPVDHGPLPTAERPMRLRSRIVRLRTMFFIAGDHGPGSRTVLRVTGDETSARRFVDHVHAYAERPLIERGLAMRPSASAAAPAPRPAAAPAQSPATPRAAPRYCHACGTALLQGSRFCQQCGQPVIGS